LRWDLELEGKSKKQECRQGKKALGAFDHLLDGEQTSTRTGKKYGQASSSVPNNRRS
jgi:hypothetical protein